MKYYKVLNGNYNEPVGIAPINKILPENFIPNPVGYWSGDVKYYVRLWPKDFQEVSEREYWQQELDAGKLVKGGYYSNGNCVIHKCSGTQDAEYFINYVAKTFKRNGDSFDTIQKNNVFELATDDEIEWLEYCAKEGKFVTKEEFMKSKEFILPDEWYVKATIENRDILIEWRNGTYTSWSNNLIMLDCKLWVDNEEYYKAQGYTEITFDQFKRHVLNIKEEMNSKKLIGYKLIKSEYKKAVANICGVIDFDFKRFETNLSNFNAGLNHLKEAGVLDLWFEKVYEPEFKVGDWVFVITGGNGALGADNFVGQICTRNSAQKVNYGGEEHTRIAEIYVINSIKSWGLCKNYKIRKATAAEIEEATKPKFPDITINGYKAEFFETYVKFGCAEISKEVFEDLYTIKEYKNTNRDIESVTIGKGTFSKEQIKQIAEYYKNK